MSRSRVESVVRVRRLQEQIARGEVFGARRTATDRQVERDRAERFVRMLASVSPAGGAEFVAQRRRVDAGVLAVRRADDAVAEAASAVAGSLADWSAAHQRLDGVERLDERLAAAEQEELDRRVAAEVDDLTVMRWNRHPVRGSVGRTEGAT